MFASRPRDPTLGRPPRRPRIDLPPTQVTYADVG